MRLDFQDSDRRRHWRWRRDEGTRCWWYLGCFVACPAPQVDPKPWLFWDLAKE